MFDAPQAVELHYGTPRVPTPSERRRAQGGSRAKSGASLDATEHGGRDSTVPNELAYATRSTIIRFTPAIAFAGFSPFGHTWAQFMMVWQR